MACLGDDVSDHAELYDEAISRNLSQSEWNAFIRQKSAALCLSGMHAPVGGVDLKNPPPSRESRCRLRQLWRADATAQ